MKILTIAKDNYPPFRVDIVELFINELCGVLKHRVDWVFCSDKPLHRKAIKHKKRSLFIVVERSNENKLKKIVDFIFSFKKLYYLVLMLNRNNYDIVQVRDEILPALIALWVSRRLKIPFVYWMSFPMAEAGMENALKRSSWISWILFFRWWLCKILLYKFILPNSRHVFVQSEQMKSDLIDLGIKASKLTPIPMGVQLRNNESIPPLTVHKNSDILVLGYLGTLAANRRLDFLVDVLNEVVKKISSVKLLFVGAGDNPGDTDNIINRAKALGLMDHIEITGMLPRLKAWERLNEATICLSPFYPNYFLRSASPTKILEYMFLKKPVVANDIPDQKNILEQSQAGLCVEWNEKAFADAIISIYQNPNRNNMGEKGFQYLKLYRSYEKLAKQLENEYLKICN